MITNDLLVINHFLNDLLIKEKIYIRILLDCCLLQLDSSHCFICNFKAKVWFTITFRIIMIIWDIEIFLQITFCDHLIPWLRCMTGLKKSWPLFSHFLKKIFLFIYVMYFLFFSDLMSYLDSVGNEKLIIEAGENDPDILRRTPINSKYV